MAEDLFYRLSPKKLKSEIAALMEEDERPLPFKAKMFAAVARLQQFDKLPSIATPDELSTEGAKGCVELLRGISSTAGVPSQIFANQLLLGGCSPER
jgi:hypothetical protein